MLLPQIPADGKERRFLFEAVIIDIFYRLYSNSKALHCQLIFWTTSRMICFTFFLLSQHSIIHKWKVSEGSFQRLAGGSEGAVVRQTPLPKAKADRQDQSPLTLFRKKTVAGGRLIWYNRTWCIMYERYQTLCQCLSSGNESLPSAVSCIRRRSFVSSLWSPAPLAGRYGG